MTDFINLKRIEFAVTYNCSSQCEHCFVDENVKKRYPGFIRKDAAELIVRKVASKYNIESIMTFGGEPLLYPEVISAIHRTAEEVGINTRQIITNGFWTKDGGKINEIARDVVGSGVNNVLISIDAFHQKYVPLSIVKKSAEALINNGIEVLKWNPCWVVSKDDPNNYNLETKEILEELEYLGGTVSSGNIVSPDGMALRNLLEYMPERMKYPEGKCANQPYTSDLDNIEGICIEPDGDIAVCKNFKIGNAIREDILDVLAGYNPYEIEEMRCILEEGAEGLLKYAEKRNKSVNPDGYYSICDMCTDIVNLTT